MNALSLDIDMLESLPAKTLLKAIENSQRVKRNSGLLLETIKSRPALFHRLEALDIDVGFNVAEGDLDLRFTGDGPKFAEVWGALRQSGWTPDSRPEKGSKKSEFYTYWRQEGFAKVWLHFTSSICKRVQVGTKTVEQPVYDVQCDQLPELIEQDEPQVPVVRSPDDDSIPF